MKRGADAHWLMERPPDREKKHSKSLIRTGYFDHPAAYGAFLAVREGEALIGQFFARSFVLPSALNVNRIAYPARFRREKMRKSWLKMRKTKTISVINKEICYK